MTEKTERSMSMLATALEMEEKGRKFYDKAASTTANPVGREVFAMLAGFEIEHVKRIKAIYKSLESGGGWSEDIATFSVSADLGSMFRKLAKERQSHIRADTGDIEALGVGIDFESASVKFYEDHVSSAEDPLEKKFTEMMAAEERTHLNLLTDMKFYYQDPESWFMEKDRVSLDGA